MRAGAGRRRQDDGLARRDGGGAGPVTCEQGPTPAIGAPVRGLAILPRRQAVSPRAPRQARGGLPERPMGADCKSAAECYGGSNPSPATTITGSRSGGLDVLSGAARSERAHAAPDCDSDPDLPKILLVASIAQW